ncbi:Protein FAF-like [Carex littledalei]|uniref:Protein FAF-like n=1 Tax=Carex littledalei TaxID=544730 RepID=A0A833QMZ3_9POAL|nr:Protein FAF-like [Carex littledalei]
MATCGSLRSLFEKPLPENPTLMESLSSWQNLMPKKPLDPASFTEIFGELHFQEKPLASTIFSWKSSDSLQLCTEGLGSESSDEVDDMANIESDDQELYAQFKEKMDMERLQLSSNKYNNSHSLSVKNEKGFPPPIPSIGRSGKPRMFFKAYREEGRFVLREIRMPSKEILRASRQDGRLKLQFACPEEDIIEGEEGERGGDEEDDDEAKEEEEDDDDDDDVDDEAKMK